MRSAIEAADQHLLAVSVRDRFGDYGLVGQMRAREAAGALNVDLCTLSCRALGRGVEYSMLAHLGALALALALPEVKIEFCKGPRNTPAAAFSS